MQIPVQVVRRWMIGVFALTALAGNVTAAPQSSSASRDNRTARSSDPTPAAQARATVAPSDSNLPVRRVVLYKSGVGFFEDQEKRLETLRQESTDLQTKKDQAQKELDDLIENLDLDATI